MIEYRIANIHDIDNLLTVRIDFLIDAGNIRNDEEKALMIKTNAEFLEKNISSDNFVTWIATDSEKIIASSSISYYTLPPHRRNPSGKVAYIASVFTYPEYRKQGIATKLFALTVETAIKSGCPHILLDATEMGRPIYEKFGFKVSTDNMFYYVK